MADSGARARDNVRKAVEAVKANLRKGGPDERAFAEHLERQLSNGAFPASVAGKVRQSVCPAIVEIPPASWH